jgi:hypothetical protein
VLKKIFGGLKGGVHVVGNRWKGGSGNLSEPNGTIEMHEDVKQPYLSPTVKWTYGFFGVE